MELTNSKENLGRDVHMEDGQIIIGTDSDFDIVKYDGNLGQAVKHRLLTVIGELYRHPNYGSDLQLYVGVNRLGLMMVEMQSAVYKALLQEPRIKSVENVVVQFDQVNREKVNVAIDILPIDSIETLNLVYDLFI